MDRDPFDKRQVREFVKQVKAEAGIAWPMFGPRLQHALIAERALYIMGSQARGTVTTDEIHWLVNAMLKEAGLE